MYNAAASQKMYELHKLRSPINNEANLANVDINEEYIIKEVKLMTKM